MVYESWEGSHNVLVAQVLTDLRRLPILEVVEERLRALLGAADPRLAPAVAKELDAALDDVRRSAADEDVGRWHFREVLDRLGTVAEVVHLAAAGRDDLAGQLLSELVPVRPGDDPGLVGRVDAIVAGLG